MKTLVLSALVAAALLSIAPPARCCDPAYDYRLRVRLRGYGGPQLQIIEGPTYTFHNGQWLPGSPWELGLGGYQPQPAGYGYGGGGFQFGGNGGGFCPTCPQGGASFGFNGGGGFGFGPQGYAAPQGYAPQFQGGGYFAPPRSACPTGTCPR